MRRDTHGPALVGRQQESNLLEAALERAVDGGGSAVLLRGESGIGKSALLEWTGKRAHELGFTVLRVVGAEAETEFAFGALHQATWPLLQRSHALSSHQRDALESAFGARAGTPPSGFAVGAAALALLDEAAQSSPLLLVLDDLHWIDSSSATVFAFLRRRCAELPLVIVGASRPDGAAAEAWPTEPVEVRALSRPDAASLLQQRYPELAATATDRLLDEAAGNPLALVELPRQLRGEQQRGVAPLPDRLPLGRRLERMFAERLASLTPAAGRVLLLAALATGPDGGSGAWLWETVGDDAQEALERIEAGCLARLDPAGRLVFRHPLVRTTVLSTASDSARREAHRVLAGFLAPDDPRRLVHEASAALLPDDALAGRLQEAGSRLARRGGDAEGALLLDRAAVLSADPAERARRLTWAAVMAARGGQLRYTAALVKELERAPVPPDIAPLFAYAVVYVDQSHRIDFESSSVLLPAALDALTASGAESFGGLAEQVYFKLLLAATYTDDPRAWEALARHRENASEAGRLCHRAWTDPSPGLAEELRAVVDRMNEEQEAGAAWLLLWTASAVDSADGDLWRRFTGLHGYATQGSVAKAKCYQDFLRGRWDLAALCLREAEAAEELGYHCNALMFRHYYAHFLAGRGDEAGLREIEQLIRPPPRAPACGSCWTGWPICGAWPPWPTDTMSRRTRTSPSSPRPDGRPGACPGSTHWSSISWTPPCTRIDAARHVRTSAPRRPSGPRSCPAGTPSCWPQPPRWPRTTTRPTPPTVRRTPCRGPSSGSSNSPACGWPTARGFAAAGAPRPGTSCVRHTTSSVGSRPTPGRGAARRSCGPRVTWWRRRQAPRPPRSRN